MKKNGLIAAVALFVAVVGVVIALAAYFKNRSSYLYDDEDDYLFDDPDDLEYYAADFDDDEAPEPSPESAPSQNDNFTIEE